MLVLLAIETCMVTSVALILELEEYNSRSYCVSGD